MSGQLGTRETLELWESSSVSRSESSEKPVPARRISRRKKILFFVVLFALLIPVVELLSWIGLRLADPQFTFHLLYLAQNRLAESGAAVGDRTEVLHPYLGWTLNPETRHEIETIGRRIPVNSLGFADNGPTLRKRSPGRLLVGITGGSVAQQFTMLGEETLLKRLSQTPRLRGVKIELVRLAFQGFKQPQQLMTLDYLLTLGGQLDVLVNIDGFNEMALCACENDPSSLFAAYPRLWDALTHDIVDPRRRGDTFRLLELRGKRQDAAQAIVKSPLRLSTTRNLLWKIRDLQLAREITALGVEINSKARSQGAGFARTGPPQRYENTAQMFQQLAELWANSSRQMHFLCQGNSIRYVHVLQPNRHVLGSKPFHKREIVHVSDREICYAQAVGKGYGLLIAEGEKLRAQGVDFRDLTQIFATVQDPIYSDACCHYNQQGNDLLALAVADAVLASLERESHSSSRTD
jgi:hypothetical protein